MTPCMSHQNCGKEDGKLLEWWATERSRHKPSLTENLRDPVWNASRSSISFISNTILCNFLGFDAATNAKTGLQFFDWWNKVCWGEIRIGFYLPLCVFLRLLEGFTCSWNLVKFVVLPYTNTAFVYLSCSVLTLPSGPLYTMKISCGYREVERDWL
jgi:hypothetical protein